MIYIHSNSPTEKAIANLLSLKEEVFQLYLYDVDFEGKLNAYTQSNANTVLFYSYQKMQDYYYLPSFEKELNIVKKIVNYAKMNNVSKIVFLTYPGAYANSDNLFLQHKGLIEQAFVCSKLEVVALKVQGIYNAYTNTNNFHELFYDEQENIYIIPRKSKNIIYAVSIYNLVEAMRKSVAFNSSSNFDIFDQISSLDVFLSKYSDQLTVQKLAPIYLYFKSYIGKYNSPAMIELFLRPIVPMYNFRTEKKLGIKLAHDEPNHVFNANTQTSIEYPSIFSLR